MFNNRFFKRFCRERNIRESTASGYESALKHYLKFHKRSLDDLMAEAKQDEVDMVPLQDRRIKKRLLNYRSYLLKSKCSPNTVRTYFTKVKTFYIHFDIEIPHLPDAKYNKLYETNYLDLPTKEHIRKACDSVPVDLKALILILVLAAEYIDELQGRSKNYVHATYIKTNPNKLKNIYKSAMSNVMIYNLDEPDVVNQEFTIVVNVFLAGKEYNIL